MESTGPFYNNESSDKCVMNSASDNGESRGNNAAGGNKASVNNPELEIKIKEEPPDWCHYDQAPTSCCGGPPTPLQHTPPGSSEQGPRNMSSSTLTSSPPGSRDGQGRFTSSAAESRTVPGTMNGHNSQQPPQIKQEPVDSYHQTAAPNTNTGKSTGKKDNTEKSGGKSKKNGQAAKKEKKADSKAGIVPVKQEKITDSMPVKKKRDRFNGMSEEEVMARTLPDHLETGLDIVIIGINPGLTAAYVGHHYAGPGNHFWKCLYLSGIITEPMNAYDDHKLLEYGIGFTNMVERTTRGSGDLTRKEIKEGVSILTEKIQKYKPKIAVFNGKGIYEVFCGHKNFYIGKQPEPYPGTEAVLYVMPSSSARCSQLPRAIDKVPFYLSLKKIRDYLTGILKHLDEAEVTFPDLELKVEPKKDKGEKQEDANKSKKTKRKSDGGAEPAPEPYGLGVGGMNLTPLPQGMHPNWVSPGGAWPQHPHVATAPHPLQHPGSQQVPTMDSMFSVPPVLVKQEDTSELASYGIPTGQPPCGFAPAGFHYMHPGGSMASAGFPYCAPHPGHAGLSHIPSSVGGSMLPFPGAVQAGPGHAADPSSPFPPAVNGHSFPSPTYMNQNQSMANSLSPTGPMSPTYPSSNQFGSPNSQYQCNGTSPPSNYTPSLSFG